MAIKTTDLQFVLSGGSTNTDPDLSLGGIASQLTTPANIFVDNFLHNCFDEVTISEASSGEYEFRHFYIKNNKDTDVLNVKIILISNTQKSTYSTIKIARGTAPINIAEQTIVNENTSPVGISESDWKTPTETNPIVIGTIPSGQYASMWFRRQVFPEALIADNQKASIRITATLPPPPPPEPCPEGTHRNPTTGLCVDDEVTPCPEGTTLVDGICVPDDGGQGGGGGGGGDGGGGGSGGGTGPPLAHVIAVVVGDIGCSDDAENVLAGIGGVMDHPDFGLDVLIANGDLSYVDDSIDCLVELLEAYELDSLTKISIGNHDDEEDGSDTIREEWLQHFSVPSGGYYSFDIQHVHFLVMDTQSDYNEGSDQHVFVTDDLETASTNPDTGWIVVCYHKPSVTSPSSHAALTDFRDIYHPLFDTYKVDIVVQSHNHTMQRTYPIKYNASNPSSPTVMSDEADQYTNVDGRIFVVTGEGGEDHHTLGTRPSYMAYQNVGDFGFFMLEWFDDQNSVVGSFLASNDEASETIHAFQIDKGIGPGDGGVVDPDPDEMDIDDNGIGWIVARSGVQGVIEQSRFNENDFRWSANVINITGGYEATGIFTFTGVGSDGHWALKHWGPNHSAPCGHEEDGECCCWYDCGIRANGDVQLQTERPHPENHDFELDLDPVNGPLYMSNIGASMDGNTIGLKWCVHPVTPGGSADNGGIRLRMWVDTDPLGGGLPNNNWQLVYDFIDNGEVLGGYEAPSEQEIESRNSDTESTDSFAGGIHWRKL